MSQFPDYMRNDTDAYTAAWICTLNASFNFIQRSSWCTGTCFIQNIYSPSSSLLHDKHLPFSPFPLRLNIFRLFVILSLTQLYRYSPEIFLFSTATFKYTYRAPLRRIDKNIQRTSHFLLLSHWNGYSHFRFALDFSYTFGIF
jgi:hypothetical protein